MHRENENSREKPETSKNVDSIKVADDEVEIIVNHAGFDDAKRIYLMKAHIVSSQQTRSRKSQIMT